MTDAQINFLLKDDPPGPTIRAIVRGMPGVESLQRSTSPSALGEFIEAVMSHLRTLPWGSSERTAVVSPGGFHNRMYPINTP